MQEIRIIFFGACPIKHVDRLVLFVGLLAALAPSIAALPTPEDELVVAPTTNLPTDVHRSPRQKDQDNQQGDRKPHKNQLCSERDH